MIALILLWLLAPQPPCSPWVDRCRVLPPLYALEQTPERSVWATGAMLQAEPCADPWGDVAGLEVDGGSVEVQCWDSGDGYARTAAYVTGPGRTVRWYGRVVEQRYAVWVPEVRRYMAQALTKATRQRARDAFIAELRLRGNISDAARAAGLRRETFYEWRAKDVDFAAAWNEALEEATDTMEREAWRRAVEGVEKPIVGRIGKDQDGIVTYVQEYSDSLMQLLLKAHRPEKYRERQDIQHSGSVAIEYVNNWREQD
jgi:hypothetical protein